MNISDLMREMQSVAGRASNGGNPLPEAVADDLLNRFASLNTKYDFKPGDLVQWKPALKNRRFPDYGVPLVVEAILSEPIIVSGADSGTPQFMEARDIRCGVIDPDGDLEIFHFDSRRFEPYSGPRLKAEA